MKRFLPFIAVLLFANFSQAQEFEWVNNFGSEYGDIATSIISTSDAYVYVGGVFAGTVDLDPGPGISNVTAVDQNDVFIARYKSNGDFIAGVSFGSVGVDFLSCLSASSDRILAGGYFAGTADFDPGVGTYNLVSNGGKDGFMVVLDTNFTLIQAKSFGAGGNDEVKDVILDGNDAYITGEFYGTVQFGDPSEEESDTLTSQGDSDIFFSRINVTSGHQWTKRIGGTADDHISAFDLFNSNFYFTGQFQRTVDFDPSSNTDNLSSVLNSDDGYVLKLTHNGEYVWAKRIGSNINIDDKGVDIKVDASGGVYITGLFGGVCDFDFSSGTNNLTPLGGKDIFLCKLDTNAGYVWAGGIGTSSSDYVQSLALDNSGNPYITGFFVGTIDFDPSSGIHNVASYTNSYNSAYMAKYTTGGALDWVESFGGLGNVTPYAIYVDGGDAVYTSGTYLGTIDFDQGSGVTQHTAVGANDIYIHKMSVGCDPPSLPTVSASTFTMCEGGSIDLTLVDADLNGADHWQWYEGSCGGTQAGTGIPFTVSPDSNTYYYVRGEGGCITSPGNCSAVHITVNHTPEQPADISGSAELCTGGGSQTYSVTNDASASSYTWNLPAGWTGSSTTNSITVTPSSNGGTLGVYATNSCGNSTPRFLTITMGDILSQPTTISGSSNICTGSGTEETYSVTNDPNASSYTWTLPNGWTGTSTTNSIDITTGTSGGTISVVANNNCGTSPARTLNVTVGETPAQPSAITASSPICSNSLGSFSVTDDPSATNYTWTLPNGWFGSSNTNSLNASVGTTSGTVSVVANNSCGTSPASTLNVTVNASPTISGLQGFHCGPGSVDLSATASAGVVNWYTVSSGGSPVHTGNTYSTPVISTTTTYYAEADDNGCTSIRLGYAANIYDLPSNAVTVSSNTITADEANATSYQWYNCQTQSNIAGENGQSFTANSSGNYAVIILNSFGCRDTSDCQQIVVVGTEEVHGLSSINVYPNPTSGDLFIQSPVQLLSIRLVDVLGKVVLAETQNTSQLSLGHLVAGSYFLELETAEGIEIKRIIVN